ncbi:MAG: hypothetical protein JRI23_03530 [Deltaproteobacteria bacterium]|jgi:hypothetical protein|nr:hypothetical protein [Deltaproteobacteria bacterium]MBW2530587.1 hypothetical protein [Deltaproteobacteria bacterium]
MPRATLIWLCLCLGVPLTTSAGCSDDEEGASTPTGSGGAAAGGAGGGVAGTGGGTVGGGGTGGVTGGWRVLPIRSEQEFQQGLSGGEAEQHPHGIARSASNPDVLYLSHDVAGSWRSDDGGDTWHHSLDRGLTVRSGQSIEVDPVDPDLVLFIVDASYDYLAEGYEGLFRSDNGGDDWTRVLTLDPGGSPSARRIYRHNVAYDPASAGSSRAERWYAAFPQGGLYRSDDGGETWSSSPLSSLSGHDVVYAVRAHPTDGQTVYVATSQGLLVSSAQGASLQPHGDLPSGAVSSLEVDPDNPSRIYATVLDVGLYRSTDGGASFSQVRAFDAANAFMNPGFPDTIYLVGTSSNTVITHDGGSSWIEDMVTEPAPGLGRDTGSWKSRIAGGLSGIVPNPTDADEAVAFSRATLWKTTDGGHVFADSSTGFTGFAWSWWNGGAAFDPNDPDRFAFFNCDVGMAITTTGGDWFENRNAQAWGWYSAGDITWMGAYAGSFQTSAGSQRMVASVGGYFNTKLMTTSDEGVTWELVANQTAEQNLFIAYHPSDPQLVYAGSRISTDGGQTFQSIDFGAYAADNPAIHGMCLADADTIYAIDESRHAILRSDDRGTTWTEYANESWTYRMLDSLPTFAADPVDCDRIYAIDGSGDLAIFDGQSWTSTGVLALAGGTEYGNHVRTVAVDPGDNQVIYAGMHATGLSCIWRSLDGGSTWEDITENLPRMGMSAMAVNPHTSELYRGSAFGTWIYPAPGR